MLVVIASTESNGRNHHVAAAERKTIVPDKFQVTLRRGEIKSLTLDRKTQAVHLQIEDTTGMVKTVPITIEGLNPGEHRVRSENSEVQIRESEKLEFEVPVEDAKSLHISRTVGSQSQ